MESFISRKRRRLSSPPETPKIEEPTNVDFPDKVDDGDSMDTDMKLALLASLHPNLEQHILLDILLAHEGSVEAASAFLVPPDSVSPRKNPKTPGYQSSLASFASTADTLKKPKLLSKKGKTLFLYSPEDIAAHTPCSIIHNFLSAKDANDLLEELMVEATTFERITFKLFDNVVMSPHTSSFYVETLEEMRRQKTEYIYNGGLITVSLTI
jgi:hypothetical protein